MTQEEKQLLLKDLCARLPYGVQVEIKPKTQEQFSTSLDAFFLYLLMTKKDDDIFDEFSIVPYLRPMSSMAEEERKEYNDIVKNTIDFYDCPKSEDVCFFIIPINWLNAHHFDYRGLIEKGLALEAPEGMYEI